MTHLISSRPARYAAVAAILVVGIGIWQMLDHKTLSSHTAWAAELTDRAVEHASTVHITGIVGPDWLGNLTPLGLAPADQRLRFDLWARKNGDVRMEVSDGRVLTVSDAHSQLYDPQSRTVYVTEGKMVTISPWLSAAFKAMEAVADRWSVSYGNAGQTGQESALVDAAYGPRSWQFQFDRQSMLPTSFKQWHNPNAQGEPAFDAQRLAYDVPLDGVQFDPPTPAGAVVKHFDASLLDKGPQQATPVTMEKLSRMADNPDSGIPAGGVTPARAAEDISRQLLEAMIRDDQARAAQLWPIVSVMSEANWQEARGGNNAPVQIIKVGPAREDPNVKIGLVVPCTVKLQDGQTQEMRLVAKMRGSGENASVVVVGTMGTQ